MDERDVFELIDRFKKSDNTFREAIDCLNKLKFYRKQFEHYSDRVLCELKTANINTCKTDIRIRYTQKPISFCIAGKEMTYAQMCKLIGEQKRKVSAYNSFRDIAFREMKIAVEAEMKALEVEDEKHRTFDAEVDRIYCRFRKISAHEQEIERLEEALKIQRGLLTAAKEKLYR